MTGWASKIACFGALSLPASVSATACKSLPNRELPDPRHFPAAVHFAILPLERNMPLPREERAHQTLPGGRRQHDQSYRAHRTCHHLRDPFFAIAGSGGRSRSVCVEPTQAKKNLRLFETVESAEALPEKLNQIKKAISEGAALNCPFPVQVDENRYAIQSHFDVPLYRATDPNIDPELFWTLVKAGARVVSQFPEQDQLGLVSERYFPFYVIQGRARPPILPLIARNPCALPTIKVRNEFLLVAATRTSFFTIPANSSGHPKLH